MGHSPDVVSNAGNLEPAGFARLVGIRPMDGTVRAVIVDPFHHFRLTLYHAGGRITDITSQALRVPFDLCPAAGNQLKALIGLSLDRNILTLLVATNARQQCTHQFDLAVQAVVAAALSRAPVCYRMTVDQADAGGQFACLEVNDDRALEWTVRNSRIEGAGLFGGVNLHRGFTGWAATALESPMLEQSLMLRRAWFISHKLADADQPMAAAPATGACWVQSPGRAETSRRLFDMAFFDSTRPALDQSEIAWLDG